MKEFGFLSHSKLKRRMQIDFREMVFFTEVSVIAMMISIIIIIIIQVDSVVSDMNRFISFSIQRHEKRDAIHDDINNK